MRSLRSCGFLRPANTILVPCRQIEVLDATELDKPKLDTRGGKTKNDNITTTTNDPKKKRFPHHSGQAKKCPFGDCSMLASIP
jgi:hypothetical protein